MENSHAQNERDLARLIARETVQDIFGGKERTHNGPGLLLGLCFVIFLLAVVAGGVYWLMM
jgi:hypothetical protein